MKTKDLLMQSKWRVFNVDIAKAIGLNETLVLMELADAEKYFNIDDTFYITYEQISENTTLSEYQVRQAVKNLKNKNIVHTEMKGLPAKQHYKLYIDRVINIETLDPPKSDRSIPLKSDKSNTLESDRSIYKEPINKEHNNKEDENNFFIKSNIKTKEKNSVKKENIIFPFTSKKFMDHWEIWTDYKKTEFNFKYKSAASIQSTLIDLNKKSGNNEINACEIIMQSIANGWKGFYQLKNNNNGNTELQKSFSNLWEKYSDK